MISKENFNKADKIAYGLVSRLTLDQKISLISQHQEAVPELGINAYKHGTEAAHGIAWLGKATVFPQPAGLACTWDTDLMEMTGEVIGMEARGFYSVDPTANGLTLWAPTVDLNRDPRWGRTDESYGEDPVLTGKLASALIKGIQGDDPAVLRAAPTLKHFYGNNNEHDRLSCSIKISERTKREYYLKVFRITIENSSVLSIMTAYNSINGIPANVHPDLQNIVRGEWEWPGFAVSDAYDVFSLTSDHHFCENDEEAAAASIKAGIDSITDDPDKTKKAVRGALEKGLLSEDYLDIALQRCLRLRCLLGEFPAYAPDPYAEINKSFICREDHARTAYKAAVKSAVLLKNQSENLPLDSPDITVSLIGNMTDCVYRDWYSGEFSTAETPLKAFSSLFAECSCTRGADIVSIRDEESGLYLQPDGSLKEKEALFEMEEWGWGASTFKSIENGKFLSCAGESVTCAADEIQGWFTQEVFYTRTGEYVAIKAWNTSEIISDGSKVRSAGNGSRDGKKGISNPTPDYLVKPEKGNFTISIVEDGIEKAVRLASQTEVPIVMIGNHPLINGKETVDRLNIDLPERQHRLASKIAEKNPKAVLIIISSYPYAPGDLAAKFKSIIYTAHGGQAAGTALTDIISGKANPAGRLAMTWYKSTEDLGGIMDYEISEAEKTYLYFRKEVLYPFGHGLSYSRFSYSALEIKEKKLAQTDMIEFTVNIKNQGTRDGEEVIQIYLRKGKSLVKRPVKQLAEFQRIFIPAGEKKILKFSVPAMEFQYWDEENSGWSWECGEAELLIGASSADIRLSEKLELV